MEQAFERARERDQRLEIRSIESVSCKSVSVSVSVSVTGTESECVCNSACTYTNPTNVSLHTQTHTHLHHLGNGQSSAAHFTHTPHSHARVPSFPRRESRRQKFSKSIHSGLV
jgi:CCR4-NOT transcriptional regulation complex NOT5 subunit